jgi:chromosomal replication initiation ATPase DnaA
MNSQIPFNYSFLREIDDSNFFVNLSNQNAYEITILKDFDQNIFLYGPQKSGKSHLINIWIKKNNAIFFNNNITEIIKTKKNIAIDDVFSSISEENLFHIINHCKHYNLKIYLTSSIDLINQNFQFDDLYSRLRSFYYLNIKIPDEEMCKMFMTKLFLNKQIIIKNKEIFDYIFNRVTRSYYDIYLLVEKIDKLSLEKKRQLTIPLIREIL